MRLLAKPGKSRNKVNLKRLMESGLLSEGYTWVDGWLMHDGEQSSVYDDFVTCHGEVVPIEDLRLSSLAWRMTGLRRPMGLFRKPIQPDLLQEWVQAWATYLEEVAPQTLVS